MVEGVGNSQCPVRSVISKDGGDVLMLFMEKNVGGLFVRRNGYLLLRNRQMSGVQKIMLAPDNRSPSLRR